VSLPAHASTTSTICNDIQWQPGLGLEGWCETDRMAVPFKIVLFSDTQFVDIDVSPYYKGELDIYSTNPAHEYHGNGLEKDT